MRNKLLLPNKYKTLGWFLLIPAAIAGILLIFSGFESYPLNARVFAVYSDSLFGETHLFSLITANITGTIVAILFIIGGLFVGFSREKNEDEFIASLRLSSLLWAVMVNYLLLLFALMFIYGVAFLNVLLYNMFTVLTIFILRFQYVLIRNKSLSNAE